MSQKNLRIFRIVFSVVFLVAIGAIFVDYREFIPVEWAKWILYPQFVPSILSFIAIPAVIATGFILIFILTLLFGRVYCSAFCPLGALQDVFSFIARKTGIIKRYKFKKPVKYLRYGFLALTVLFLLAGSTLVLGLLDPYSIFGRTFSDILRPGVVVVNNVLARALEKREVYFLFQLDMGLFSWRTVAITVVTAGLVIWLSLYFGRLYCNTVCPVGTSLGLLSRLSFFRIKMDQSSCTRCGKCSFKCKANCIDVKNMQVDFSRCVACYDCIPTCDTNSIGYRAALPWKKENASAKSVEAVSIKSSKTGSSKRQFISASLLFGLSLAGINRKSLSQVPEGTLPGDIPNDKKYPVSPPGSVSLEHFNAHCTSCHLCVTACPTRVLQPALFEYGLKGMMQPYMDYHREYCNYECTICGEVCPTNAILKLTVDDKKLTQIGVVNLILEKCVVVTDNTACGSCSEHCPTQAVKMVPYTNGLTIPEIDPQYCIGCGACEHACPVQPYTAIFVDGNPVQKVAVAPVIEELDNTVQDDFLF